MEPISVATAALGIAEKAWKALEAVRERAQASKDVELKARIGDLYDDFLALRSVIVRLTDENADLRRSETEAKPEIRQVGEVNYYFVGESGPFCQKCYDKDGKLTMLGPRLEGYTGGPGRKCQLCGTVFHEQHKAPPRMQIKPYTWS